MDRNESPMANSDRIHGIQDYDIFLYPPEGHLFKSRQSGTISGPHKAFMDSGSTKWNWISRGLVNKLGILPVMEEVPRAFDAQGVYGKKVVAEGLLRLKWCVRDGTTIHDRVDLLVASPDALNGFDVVFGRQYMNEKGFYTLNSDKLLMLVSEKRASAKEKKKMTDMKKAQREGKAKVAAYTMSYQQREQYSPRRQPTAYDQRPQEHYPPMPQADTQSYEGNHHSPSRPSMAYHRRSSDNYSPSLQAQQFQASNEHYQPLALPCDPRTFQEDIPGGRDSGRQGAKNNSYPLAVQYPESTFQPSWSAEHVSQNHVNHHRDPVAGTPSSSKRSPYGPREHYYPLALRNRQDASPDPNDRRHRYP